MYISVVPSGILEIFDGTDTSYAEKVSVIRTENQLLNTFSGWKLNFTKPIEELEVSNKKNIFSC